MKQEHLYHKRVLSKASASFPWDCPKWELPPDQEAKRNLKFLRGVGPQEQERNTFLTDISQFSKPPATCNHWQRSKKCKFRLLICRLKRKFHLKDSSMLQSISSSNCVVLSQKKRESRHSIKSYLLAYQLLKNIPRQTQNIQIEMYRIIFSNFQTNFKLKKNWD